MSRTLSIGPLNSASQASAWARALGNRRGYDAFTVAFDGFVARVLQDRTVNDTSDHPLPHYRLAPPWWRQRRARQTLAAGSHHLNESNMPLFGDPRRTRFTDEADTYRNLGISASVVFHGSDARDPDLSIALNQHSFFKGADSVWVDRLRERARRNRESVRQSGLRTFVTTPDMLQHVENATLLPISLSLTGWNATTPPLERAVPRVLHRPSSNISSVKGTSHIVKVLDQLERKGRIEVLRSDVVPHNAMPALIKRSDVVIDQIQTGAYGVTAIEAMASGRVVVGSLSQHTRNVMGGLIPVIDANPENLSAVLQEVLEDRAKAQHFASEGPRFVRKWHDGNAAADVLAAWLKE